MTLITPEHLRPIAQSTRRFLETQWSAWHAQRGAHPNILSEGTCGRTSLFLQKLLLEEYQIETAWRTGSPLDSDGACGYFFNGKWHGHSWLEVNDWILDITADQFHEAPTVILSAQDNRYRAGRDLAYRNAIQQRLECVNQLWKEWKDKR